MDSARALVAKGRGIALVSRTMGVSRAQLSLRINRSADWQDRRCNRRDDEADAEILSEILDIISDMPVTAIVCGHPAYATPYRGTAPRERQTALPAYE
jgi:putative transposase